MATYQLSWTPPTVDTTGSPLALTGQRLYRDGVLAANLTPAATIANVTLPAGTTAQYDVRGVAGTLEGAPSNQITIVVPSGIPAAITDLGFTQTA